LRAVADAAVPAFWQDVRVPTKKQGIRMADPPFKAVQARARTQGSDATKVAKAAFVLYLRGALDELLGPLLAEPRALDPLLDGLALQHTGQDPAAGSLCAMGHSPSLAISRT
jgi:hypothetical protein